MAFSLIAITLGTNSVIWQAWCLEPIIWQAWYLHFPTLGAVLSARDALGDNGSSKNETLGSGGRFLVILE